MEKLKEDLKEFEIEEIKNIKMLRINGILFKTSQELLDTMRKKGTYKNYIDNILKVFKND